MKRLDSDELNTIIIVMLSVILGIVIINSNGSQVIYSETYGQGIEEVTISDADEHQSNPRGYGNYVVWQDFRNGNWDIYLYNIETGRDTPLNPNTNKQISPDIFEDIVVWQEVTTINGTQMNEIVAYNITDRSYQTISDVHLQYTNPRIIGNSILFLGYGSATVGYGELHVFDLETGIDSLVFNDRLWYAGFSVYDGRCAIFERSNALSVRTNDAYLITIEDLSATRLSAGQTDWTSMKCSIGNEFAVFTAYDVSKSQGVLITHNMSGFITNTRYYETDWAFSLQDNNYAVFNEYIVTSVRVRYGGTSDYIEYISFLDRDLNVISNIGIMRVNIGKDISIFDDRVVYEYYENSGNSDISMIEKIG